MGIIEEYLFYQEKFVKKYGERTIVFMQVGSFHEAYGTDTRGYRIAELSDILNIMFTKKDKTKPEVDESNPYMIGFPTHALQKFLQLLIGHGFTVVIVDQVTPPPKPKREITGIYSPGTYIEESMSQDANNIISIYIEDEPQKNGKILSCIGMSVVDLSTGHNTTYEIHSTEADEKMGLDEIVRFINSYSPKEILLSRKVVEGNSMNKTALLSYLELENKPVHYTEKVKKNLYKLSYQSEFLTRVFPDTGMLSPIEYADMEKTPYVVISYIILMDYAYQHNENIIKNLHKPETFQKQKHLILGNNAVYQLNILGTDYLDSYNKRFNSLFDVVNNTSTAIGRRFLKKTLLAPIMDTKELNNRYSNIESMMTKDAYKKYEESLRGIGDLERMHRKLTLQVLHPHEFVSLMDSYTEVLNLATNIKKNKKLAKMVPNKTFIKSVQNLIKDCEDTFIYPEMKKYNINNIASSFLKKGRFTDIDSVQEEIDGCYSFIDETCKSMSKLVDGNKEGSLSVSAKKNDRDGYYLTSTKIRTKSFQKNMEKSKWIPIGKTFKLNAADIVYKDMTKSTTKMFFDKFCKNSDRINALETKMMTVVKEKYVDLMKDIHEKHKTTLLLACSFVEMVDFVKSGAKTAKEYNYCKPTVVEKEDGAGFVSCKGMRHPIIERLCTDTEYIPHDISLGQVVKDAKPKKTKSAKASADKDLDGMLIYGYNSSGKSSLMKAIGLSTVMAQAGMFVPANSMTFAPYSALFARITGNDNIFKGQSSFTLEMTELRALLGRAGPQTLIIGDEICRGTENESAVAIVTASIIRLSHSRASFIFATHLHALASMKRILDLDNVKSFHLTVGYDPDNDVLIFDRKIKPGSGEKGYGLTVAKYIIRDNDFMKLAQEIKNENMEVSNSVLPEKTSKYNKNVYMDKCGVCNKQVSGKEDGIGYLDTHHINFQKDCEDGFVKSKPHLPMNSKANLIVLCKKCHQNVHNNKFKITGYVETSNGRKLNIVK